jgi:hypothetical protein
VAANFPFSKDNTPTVTVGDGTHPSADEALSSTTGGPAHHALHQNVGLAIRAIEDKVGTGDSDPAANTVLTSIDSGTSVWGTVSIVDDQVTQAKIAPLAVGTTELAADAVDGTKIAADAVDGTKIADDAINSEHIAAGAIDTEHIADSQVTAGKLAEAYYTETESDARFLGITAKAADSDKLDNLDSTQFLRADQDDTMVGALVIDDDASVSNAHSLRVIGNHGNSATIDWSAASLVIDDTGSYPSLSFRSAYTNHSVVLRLSTATTNKLLLRNLFDNGWADLEIGSLTQSSDLTLKTKTGDAPGLDLVNRLAPFKGHWNDQPGEVNFWLGAQEVAEALTGAGFDPAECGVVQDAEDTMGLQYTQLVPVLVKAVQELTARLEAVEG